MIQEEDIITRMNSLEGLPVSEETLGAYLEGNLTADEAETVDDIINEYPELLDIDGDFLTGENVPALPDYDFRLPEIPDGAMLDDTPGDTDNDLPEVEVDLTDDDITFQYHDIATMEEVPTYVDEEELDDIYAIGVEDADSGDIDVNDDGTDIDGGWDGTWHGKQVKDGTYYVLVKARGADGRNYNIKRDVNILRNYTEE